MRHRYEVLDGLRGTAALAVAAMHLTGAIRPDAETNPLHHGYLAVDFFFMLSGFVIGHAYDDRWGRMTRREFALRRIIRLQPLAVLGVTLGALVYLLDPADPSPRAGLALFAANLGLNLFLLPAPGLPGAEGMTHGLDMPTWSLTQEYLASFAYALIGPRLGRAGLSALVVALGGAVVFVAMAHQKLDGGWSWATLWVAPVRSGFGFFAGLLLQRSGLRFASRAGWLSLSIVLLACLAAPTLGPLNGLFEAAVVIGVFPLLIAAGAGARLSGGFCWFCRRGGELSYPLYLIHAPLVGLYTHWSWGAAAPHAAVVAAGAGLGLALPVLAWLVYRFYDAPVRAWLTRIAPRPVPAAQRRQVRAWPG